MTRPQRGRSTRDKDEARESCRVLLTPQNPQSQKGLWGILPTRDEICLPATSSPQSRSHSLWLQEPHNWRKFPLCFPWQERFSVLIPFFKIIILIFEVQSSNRKLASSSFHVFCSLCGLPLCLPRFCLRKYTWLAPPGCTHPNKSTWETGQSKATSQHLARSFNYSKMFPLKTFQGI